MTVFLSSLTTSNGTAYSILSGASVFLRDGFYVSTSNTTTGYAFNATSGSVGITIAGIAEGSVGVRFGGSSVGTLSVLETGTVLGRSVGVLADSTGTSALYFNNAGLVQGELEGLNISVEGAFLGSNTGIIRGITNDGVRIQSQGAGSFVNFGLIETLSATNNAVDIYHDGSPGIPVTFINYGTISAFSDYALEMDSNDMNTARNFGTFNGGAFFGSNDDYFENGGVVNGDVGFSAGHDFYLGLGGVTNGLVDGGEGNDTLRGGDNGDRFQGGDGLDVLRGGSGIDTLFGGNDNDRVSGGEDADIIAGGMGFDILLGNRGNDEIEGGGSSDDVRGQMGDDVVHGSGGADRVDGGSGDDMVFGEQGDDWLVAGSGQDTLIGGFGRDQMYAGAGEDTFIWNSAGDSGSFAGRDKVWDFAAGEDLLDFSNVVGPALAFRGMRAFTGNDQELRIVENAFGNTIIQVDINGNGFANMYVQIEGVGLTIDDFIL